MRRLSRATPTSNEPAGQRYDPLGLTGLKDEAFVSVIGNFVALRRAGSRGGALMSDPDRSRSPRLQPVLLVGGEAERDGAGLGYDHLLTNVVPRLRQRGLSEVEVNTLIIDNPSQIFGFASPDGSL